MAIVEASDGGELEVKLLTVYGAMISSLVLGCSCSRSGKDFNHGSTYLEVIGQVVNERTIKMAQYVNLGDDVGE